MEYLGYKVTRVMTLTDVEDKAIQQAKKEKLSVEELTRRNEAVFFEDFKTLRIKTPDYSVRASSAVDQAVKLVSQLLDKSYAYRYKYKGSNNVYFDPLKFKGFGKLAHLDMRKWPKKKRRFHKDTYPGTPWNMGDFLIWHGCKQDDVCYDTKIGAGRPSWNLQDVAIVTKHLGFSVDLACGGIDNLVRHHDYTLAIAEAVSSREFSRYWLHGGHLFVDGKKMSKSRGNVYYLNDVLAKGFSAEQVRFFLIYGPYREKLNFTFEKIAETSRKLNSFKSMVNVLEEQTEKSRVAPTGLSKTTIMDFESHMNNDLDVKGAFDSLHQTIAMLYEQKEELSDKDANAVLASLRRINSVLQCIF